MKISAVAEPFCDTNLRLLKQLGVDDYVYYKMEGMPIELEELTAIKAQVERAGLHLSVVEGGPPIDRIVLGKEGRDQQIEDYKKALINMGKLGIRVLCYNFMPQVCSDAMVVRTNTQFRERGGALTSQFRLDDLRAMEQIAGSASADSGAGEHRKTSAEADPTRAILLEAHKERATTDEQMWDNLEYFLKRIVPIAEAAEVKLAMHPDDPPLSPICGLSRIMRSIRDFDRLLQIAPTQVNGVTLCQGCFVEMGCDIPSVIRHFAGRIHFVHFRDVRGTPTDFHETFPDNGPTDLIAAFRTYKEICYDGFIRVDHVPLLATEEGTYSGYGLQGHVFAIGYLKGLMQPIFGKPTAQ